MNLLSEIKALYKSLQKEKISDFNRHVSFGDLISEREEIANALGFGKGTTCYDNVLVLGNVKVGVNTWIGPNVILDGTGNLEIGNTCSICAGVQIYTHDTVEWAVSMGDKERVIAPTRIGSGVYIGPNTVIQKGVTIGDQAIIGAMSFVNQDIPACVKAWGVPAQPIA